MSDEVTPEVQEARARLINHFKEHKDDPGQGWSALWDEGSFIPWDKGFPNPALYDVLSRNQALIGHPLLYSDPDSPKRKAALVPGCGKGVDVLLLASFGYDAVGLEVSQTAVQIAERFRAEHQNDEMYQVKDDKIGMGQVKFICGDFFKDDWLEREDT